MIVASHSNPRAIADGRPPGARLRDQDDRRARRRGRRDARGVGAAGEPRMDAVCEAIEEVAEAAGSARHVAIGSDYDGGFGSELTPDELDTIADHRKIGEALAARGWGADDVAGVLGGNWLRVLGGLYA